VPVTIYWGGESEITPVAEGRELATAADAKLAVFEDADLLPHAEFPAEFRSVLRSDLDGTDDATAGDERSDADATA
jgi:pimeloyl-ACP methyl ester carboxylesterase